MFRNYLMTALRNLARNRLYAGVTILGLTIGFTVAILIAVFVRFETSYDRSFPGGERIYQMYLDFEMAGGNPIHTVTSFPSFADSLKADFSQFEQVARIAPGAGPVRVRGGKVVALEDKLVFADASVFRIFALPVVDGDPVAALDRPDGLVLTRSQARKYFGDDRAIGRSLDVGGHPFEVRSVIEDLPGNTHLDFNMAASGQETFRRLIETRPFDGNTTVYVKLKEGAGIGPIEAAMPAFAERRSGIAQLRAMGLTDGKIAVGFSPLADIHLTEFKLAPLLWALTAVAGLIVVVAAINFVTLMTARAGRRAVEVGVRKASGASRRALVFQFMGEALIYVLLALAASTALAEVLLPLFNVLIGRAIPVSALHDATLLGGIAVVAILVGLAAGLYPALVLSGFRPAVVLKGGPSPGGSNARVREAPVVVQFAILIALVLCAATIYRQTLFGMREALRVDSDQVYVQRGARGACTQALRDEVARLPGVARAACSSSQIFNPSGSRSPFFLDGRNPSLGQVEVNPGFFELYGVKPIAGRLFDPARAADLYDPSNSGTPSVLLSAMAMRRLGVTDPADILGREIGYPKSMNGDRMTLKVIGVVPDFSFTSTHEAIGPVVYFSGGDGGALHVKLKGGREAQTIAAIDRISERAQVTVERKGFLGQIMRERYEAEILQAALLGAAALIALVIAALGLFALSAYTTERRTKEIGVRKAMGARSADVLRLLMTQFARPIVIANLIAWPLAWLAMNRWLKGFAYRIDQSPWLYLAVGAGAVAIALATVLVHALKVAREKPVRALRYE